MKRFFQNAALLLLSILLPLALAEGALWLVTPPAKIVPFENGLWATTPFGVGLRPNASELMDNRRDYRGQPVHTDADGRRVVPAAAAVSEPVRRIWLIGDSQTFGFGLSDTDSWPNRLQEILLERGYRGTKVLNLGVPGINVDQYFERFKYIAPKLKPGDVVLVGMTWNDISTPQATGLTLQVVNGYLTTLRGAPPVETPARPASSAAPKPATAAEDWRMKIYRLTGFQVPRLRGLKPFLEDMAANSALVSFLMPHIREAYFRLRSDNNPFRAIFDAGAAENNFAMLGAMREGAQRAEVRFGILFLSSRFFFEDAVYAAYSQGGTAFPARNYQAHVALPLCARHKIRCFDPFDLLVARNREGLVFPVDGHYNPRGARLIAGFAADAVAGLLGPPARDEKPRPERP